MSEYVGKASGRICLLGDNTDLIEKPALAAAISAYLTVNLARNANRHITLNARDIPYTEEFELGKPPKRESPLRYLTAVYKRLADKIDSGFDASIASEIPISAGLSSSTALCIGFIDAVNQAYELGLSTAEIAELAFVVENEDLGVECGRMDQYAIAFGGVTFRLESMNVLDGERCWERTRYVGATADGILEEIENYCYAGGRKVALKIKTTF